MPPVLITADCDHHLVEVPVVARPGPGAADVGGNGGSELQNPSPDGLVGDIDTPLSEHFLDVPQ